MVYKGLARRRAEISHKKSRWESALKIGIIKQGYLKTF